MTKVRNGDKPLVSIVIPVFNGANYLDQAIDSALAQTWPHTEVIVVDDGSTDNGATRAVMARYGDRIRPFHKPNGGVASAVKMGVAKMRGDYFSWLSHDDLYHPEKTAVQIEALLAFGRPGVAYSEADLIDEAGQSLPHLIRPFDENLAEEHALWSVLEGYINGCAILVSRECLVAAGPFNTSLPTTQDYEIWFRIARQFPFLLVPGRWTTQRLHDGQVSRQDRHLDEAGLLWLSFLDRLTVAEMHTLAGSPQRFVKRMQAFTDRAPYRGARLAVANRFWRFGRPGLRGFMERRMAVFAHRWAGQPATADAAMIRLGMKPTGFREPDGEATFAARIKGLRANRAAPDGSECCDREASASDNGQTPREAVAFILHDHGGGTARYGAELAGILRSTVDVYFLRARPDGVEMALEDRFREPVLFTQERKQELVMVLRRLGVRRVGVLHIIGWGDRVIDLLESLDLPFDLFFFDYHLVADHPHLANDAGHFVGEEMVPTLIISDDPVRRYLLDRADRLIACSNDLASRLKRVGVRRRVEILVPPGTNAARRFQCRMPPLAQPEAMRVLVLGTVSSGKGRAELLTVAKLAAKRRLRIEFHLHGTLLPLATERESRFITVHGLEGASVLDTVCWLNPHVAWLPFQLPETHSYVLTDAMLMGLPIAAGEIGAVAERLEDRPLTWTKPWDTDPEGWLALFETIRSSIVPNAMPDMAVSQTQAEMTAAEYLKPMGIG